MTKTDDKRLYLIGWIIQNTPEIYFYPCKMHAFIFIYECFSKADGEAVDFSGFKVFEHCLIYENIWNEYLEDTFIFYQKVKAYYKKCCVKLNQNRLIVCSFVVRILNEKEIFELIHSLDICSAQKKQTDEQS